MSSLVIKASPLWRTPQKEVHTIEGRTSRGFPNATEVEVAEDVTQRFQSSVSYSKDLALHNMEVYIDEPSHCYRFKVNVVANARAWVDFIRYWHHNNLVLFIDSQLADEYITKAVKYYIKIFYGGYE